MTSPFETPKQSKESFRLYNLRRRPGIAFRKAHTGSCCSPPSSAEQSGASDAIPVPGKLPIPPGRRKLKICWLQVKREKNCKSLTLQSSQTCFPELSKELSRSRHLYNLRRSFQSVLDFENSQHSDVSPTKLLIHQDTSDCLQPGSKSRPYLPPEKTPVLLLFQRPLTQNSAN